MRCSNNFWLYNPVDLLCSNTFIPLNNMDLEDQMNSLTRYVIFIFFILFLINCKYSLIFLGAGIILIIIIYLYKKSAMKENFDMKAVKADVMYNKQSYPNSNRFCKNAVVINPGENYMSSNQALAGFQNKRANIKPIIAPPSHDLDHWRANNFVVHSHINDESIIDTYQSGYDVSTCCGYMCDKKRTPVNEEKVLFNPVFEKVYGKPSKIIEQNEKKDTTNVFENDGIELVPIEDLRENFTLDGKHDVSYTETLDNRKGGYINSPSNGDVNTSCGYNPNQLYKYNLPTNYIAGTCQKNDAYKEYNKNLFTQTIQPGVYSRSEIIEPINSNIGISFEQQLEPVTCKSTDESLEYTVHDPRIIEPVVVDAPKPQKATYDNVFDPRFYGYGTSYRSYIDELTGQPRFMYDDINAIRMPNYITRSKIDFEPYADSFGPLPENGAMGNEHNASIRTLAQDSFLRNSLMQRNDLQQRAMRKMDTVLAQRREMPIRRF